MCVCVRACVHACVRVCVSVSEAVILLYRYSINGEGIPLFAVISECKTVLCMLCSCVYIMGVVI